MRCESGGQQIYRWYGDSSSGVLDHLKIERAAIRIVVSYDSYEYRSVGLFGLVGYRGLSAGRLSLRVHGAIGDSFPTGWG